MRRPLPSPDELPPDFASAPAANDALPPATHACPAACAASIPRRCAALARLVLEAAEAQGLLLPAAAAAIELLVAGNVDAPLRAQGDVAWGGDPRAELAARCIARLAVEARDPSSSPAYLRRYVTAVLGQLDVRDAAARVESAWRSAL